MNDTIATILRSLLKVGGGALVTRGLTTDASLESAIGAVIVLVGFVWGIINAKRNQSLKTTPTTHNLQPLLAFILLPSTFILLSGCARFSTHQTDESQNPKTGETRTITTHASAFTFFSARSELTKFKASQTDKTQSASVGSLNQEADGTNAVALINTVVSAAVSAAIKAK